ncbi:HU family DNA-binding protein [Variovorax sp. GB1R11]|uniref:HU family DNA-binding protein n=1 Tax=Variovorax sp. GB1R11 TaxID=3443741 RepID=UPI003F46F4D5
MAKLNLLGTQLNRIELVEKIATAHNVSKAEAARILETITGSIVAAVKKGDPVQIVGFGTFKQVARAARSGFNPSAGTKIKIAAQKVPKFVPGAAFKAAVDPKAAKRKADKAVVAKPAAKSAAKKAVPAKKAAAPAKKAAAKKK